MFLHNLYRLFRAGMADSEGSSSQQRQEEPAAAAAERAVRRRVRIQEEVEQEVCPFSFFRAPLK